MRPALIWGAVLAALAVLCGTATAHFKLNLNIRVVHVEHLDDGLRVFIRLPMPYLVADQVGPERADGSRVPAPYTTNRVENGRLMHYLDAAALRRDPWGLGQRVAQSHPLTVADQRLTASVEAVRAYPGLLQPPFATLEEAKAALNGPVYAEDFPVTYVGDTVLDVALRYRSPAVGDYAFASTLDPGLPGQADTANLLLDYFPGETRIFRASGLLHQPIRVSRSPLAAAWTFIKEGVRHILSGFDHVLFVLCLALGASALGQLLWRVSGFTLGHSITLALGFFGYTPSGAWFVPTVEAGIALSIIYAAALAVVATHGSQRSTTAAVATAIGLLHGLGFSFVLHEILNIDAPNLWQSLLAFNLGVEAGQVAIILAVWPLFHWLARRSQRWWRLGQWLVALPCIAIAALWTGERTMLVWQAL